MAVPAGTTLLNSAGLKVLNEFGVGILADGITDCECCPPTPDPFTCSNCDAIVQCHYAYNKWPNSLTVTDTSTCFTGQFTGIWLKSGGFCHWKPTGSATGFGSSGIEIDSTTSFIDFNGTNMTMEVWTTIGDLLWQGLSVHPSDVAVLGRVAGESFLEILDLRCSDSAVDNCSKCASTFTISLGGSMLGGCNEVVPNGSYTVTQSGTSCVWLYGPDVDGNQIVLQRSSGLYDQYEVGLLNGTIGASANAVFVNPDCLGRLRCPPGVGAGALFNPTHRFWTSRSCKLSP